MGAAVVAGLTQLLLFVLFFQAINKYYGRTFFLPLVWKPALAAVGMSLILVQASWSLFPSFFAGVGVYFVLLLLLRAFNEYDFLVMRNVFNRTE